MSQADRIYKLAFRKNFTNHECNFPPTKEVALGDYGVMKNGFFVSLGNISDERINIPFQVKKDQNPTRETFKSANDISVSFKAKGAVTVDGVAINAQVEVGFGSEKAVFFSAANVYYNEMRDIPTIGDKILQLYKQGIWKKEYLIVTRLFEGTNVIILISGTSSCKVVIEAGVDIPAIDLGDTGLKLNIASSSQTAYEIIANNSCQIGMGFSRVYDSLFIKPNFKGGVTNSELFASLDHTPSTNVVFGDTVPGDPDEMM